MTRAVEDRKETEGRYWEVHGDMESKQLGEPFRLFENLDHYAKNRPKRLNRSGDLLRRLAEDDDTYHGTVFDAKTQGYPYCAPLLAVAVWVETCFPQHAHVSGDIDQGQCREAVAYIARHLGEDAELPLSVSPQRLLACMADLYQGTEVMDRFERIYRGSESDSLKALLAHGDPQVVRAWLCKSSKENTINTLGSITWSTACLNAGVDIDDLCHILLGDERGPGYDPVDLAGDLAATWVSIPISKREALDVLNKPEGRSDTIPSQFGGIFMDMGGLAGRRIKAYVPAEQIIETLCTYGPEKAAEIESRFYKRHERALEELKGLSGYLDKLNEMHDQGKLPDSDGEDFLAIKSMADLSEDQKAFLDVMAYNVQRWRRMMVDDERLSVLLDLQADDLRGMAAHLIERNRIVLTEDAWSWIDDEQDRDLLMAVGALSGSEQRGMLFWNLRWAVLESRELCEWVAKRSYEEIELPFDPEEE